MVPTITAGQGSNPGMPCEDDAACKKTVPNFGLMNNNYLLYYSN